MADLQKKFSDEFEFLSGGEEADSAWFLNEALGQSLFSQKKFFVFSNFLAKEDSASLLSKILADLSSSSTGFVFFEEEITADLAKKIAKLLPPENFWLEKKTSPEKEKPDFSFSNALLARDKKQSWVLLQQSLDKEVAPEMLHGSMWYVLKNLLAVFVAPEMLQSLHPFVKQNTIKASQKYSQKELEKMLAELLDGYSIARSGGLPLELFLEKFILKNL